LEAVVPEVGEVAAGAELGVLGEVLHVADWADEDAAALAFFVEFERGAGPEERFEVAI
jgi:hypothetical protein